MSTFISRMWDYYSNLGVTQTFRYCRNLELHVESLLIGNDMCILITLLLLMTFSLSSS